MSERLSYAFLVVSYNRPHTLPRLVQSLAECDFVRQGFPVELILLNNASTTDYKSAVKEVREICQQAGIDFHYHHSDRNLGCAQGRNRLAELASHDVLVFIDDDAAVCQKDFLTVLDSYFSSNPQRGILAYPAYEPQKNHIWVPHKRKAVRRRPYFHTYYFSGSAHALSRALFQKVGGYSAFVTDRGEEYDLSYKVIDQGGEIYYTTDTFVLHYPGLEGRLPSPQVVLLQAVNRMNIAYAYLPWPYVLTQAVMWSLYLLAKTRRPDLLLKAWRRMGKGVPRRPLSKQALAYLRKVRARLWY